VKTFKEMISEISTKQYRRDVKEIINKLERDRNVGPDLDLVLNYFGPETRCFVRWAIQQTKAKNYLEIGTRRGWSAAMAATSSPECEIYCFDMWQPNYSSADNPGPDFVQNEMAKLGYNKKINFISGDSHQTVPEFFKKNPDLFFDVILVDGDHSVEGALDDLRNTMGRVNPGGFLIFDDIVICERLDEVWDFIAKEYPNFDYYAHTKNKPGVGIAYCRELKQSTNLQD
jgi:predicted O-methyltransferase YrrM